MRIFASVFSQETNTFSPIKTDMQLFKRGYAYKGSEVVVNLENSNTEAGGVIDFCKANNIEVIWGPAYYAVAAGKIKDETFRVIEEEILNSLKIAGILDGIVLCLHGALVAETCDDCEGKLLTDIRNLVGNDIPIALTLDYHANLTKLMVEKMDVCAGFRTYPHVDFADTAKRACNALVNIIDNRIKPVKLFRKIPMIVPVENSETGNGICKFVMDSISNLTLGEDVLSAAFFCAQPWLDIKEMGLGLVVFSSQETNIERYKRIIDSLVDYILNNRKRLLARYSSFDDIMQKAKSFGHPTILVDSGDVTTAGAVGDSTHMLRGFLDTLYDVSMVIVSPKAVRCAFEKEDGECFSLIIGGDKQNGYNNDVLVDCKLIKKSEELSIIHGESFNGLEVDCGKKAYIQIEGHINVILTEYSAMTFDPQFFLDMGINPEDMDFIVMKSHKLFRSAYKNIAKDVVIVDTPGCTSMNIAKLDYKVVKKNIFPFVV